MWAVRSEHSIVCKPAKAARVILQPRDWAKRWLVLNDLLPLSSPQTTPGEGKSRKVRGSACMGTLPRAAGRLKRYSVSSHTHGGGSVSRDGGGAWKVGLCRLYQHRRWKAVFILFVPVHSLGAVVLDDRRNSHPRSISPTACWVSPARWSLLNAHTYRAVGTYKRCIAFGGNARFPWSAGGLNSGSRSLGPTASLRCPSPNEAAQFKRVATSVSGPKNLLHRLRQQCSRPMVGLGAE